MPPLVRAAEAGDAVAVLRKHAAGPVRGVAPQPAARAVAPAVDRAAFHVNDEGPAGNLHAVAEDGDGHDHVVAGGQGGGAEAERAGRAAGRRHHPAKTRQLDLRHRAVAGGRGHADRRRGRGQRQVAAVEIDGAAVVVHHDLLGRIALRGGLGVVDSHDADLVDAVGKARRIEVERPAAAGQRVRRTDQPVHEQLQRADAGGDVRIDESRRCR